LTRQTNPREDLGGSKQTFSFPIEAIVIPSETAKPLTLSVHSSVSKRRRRTAETLTVASMCPGASTKRRRPSQQQTEARLGRSSMEIVNGGHTTDPYTRGKTLSPPVVNTKTKSPLEATARGLPLTLRKSGSDAMTLSGTE
jgi:hypothetical protein